MQKLLSRSAVAAGALDPHAVEPLYRQLYERLRQAILRGNLAPGSKIPSTRALADELHIARNTVVTAYEQLFAEGYLEGKLGSGTYVSQSLPEQRLQAASPRIPAARPIAFGPVLSKRGAALAEIPSPVSREQETVVAFRHGLPAVDAFPFNLWARLTARLWRTRPRHLLSYGDSAGYRRLREAIAAYLATSRGVRCDPDQIIVVSGSQQALDLATRALLDPGDAAWIEDPGYLGARAALLAAGARLIPLAVDHEGMQIPAIDDTQSGSVRMAYVTPAHQYPLGVTMSMARRLTLLDWAKRNNAWILEDDYDSEYRYQGRPLAALQGIDGQGRVIYVGTFSKVLFPSLRLGYLVVPPALVDAFARSRFLCDGHSSVMSQAVLAEFIQEGHFARHVRRMRLLYGERQEVLVSAATNELAGLLDVAPCDAGMHLMGWLPKKSNDRAVAELVRSQGIATTPLAMLSMRALRQPGLLLGYTAINSRSIREGVRKLASVLEGCKTS
jgi:GntR family transcriptional regulator/MocR family aminotransferase